MKALIIDDDANVRLIIEKMLEMINFNVDFAENGQEGVLKLKRKTYDIIFLDIKMPGITGEQVLNILDRLNQELPVVITSGYLTKEMLTRFKKRKIKKFLAKPFDTETFYKTINQVCGLNIKIQN